MAVIGIRPIVDRMQHGVRESQEEHAMQLALNVASLISDNVFDRHGHAVKCIIADTTIGGAAEAAACARKFALNDVCASITVTPAWCYASEVIDMDARIPKAIWGVNGTDVPGAVTLAAAIGTCSQKGLPIYAIYGQDIQDANDANIPDDVREKILRFARAALCLAQMKDRSVLSIGSVSMGMSASALEAAFFEDYLGMRAEYCDMTEVYRRIEKGIYDKSEYNNALYWVSKNCIEGKNACQATQEQKKTTWGYAIKMAMVVRDLMVGNSFLADGATNEDKMGRNALIAGFEGAREWSDFLPNGDFMETILNSSFDWNGCREPHIVATENDTLNAASMLFGNLLTNTAQIFTDVRAYWSPKAVKRVTGQDLPKSAENGLIHLINSGPTCIDGTGAQSYNGEPVIKPFWKITDQDVNNCLEATRFYPHSSGGWACGGFTTKFLTKPGMPMTMIRINMLKNVGPVLQLAQGFTVNLPDEVHRVIDNRTDPEKPTTYFVPTLTGKGAFSSVYDVMANWGANHAAVCYGHIGADLLTLASMLRIPVNMHNVADNEIFRPAVWASFGSENKESADFAACSKFGPLYK